MQIEIKQEQQLSARQLQSLQVLQMSRIDLLRCLNTLAEENPVVDLETPAAEETFSDTANDLERRLHWLEDVGPGPGRTAYAPEEETLSPVDRIGTDGGLWETLPLFLRRQIADLPVSRTDKALLCYLSDCLDDDGYMRFSDAELAEGLSAPEEQVSRGMARLRRLEPAGIGARDLPQCLLLQLERLGDESAAVPIVREYLEPLGRGRFRAIAAALGIPEEEVRRALAKIRQLDPYPGRQFCRAERPAHILPDILVTEQDGVYVCDESRVTRAEFRISSFYRQLYDTTDDPEVRQYLKGKLQQADHMLRAVHQRRSTLLRCGMFIARHQQDFFRLGSRGLHPLCMTDAAADGFIRNQVGKLFKCFRIHCAERRQVAEDCTHGFQPALALSAAFIVFGIGQRAFFVGVADDDGITGHVQRNQLALDGDAVQQNAAARFAVGAGILIHDAAVDADKVVFGTLRQQGEFAQIRADAAQNHGGVSGDDFQRSRRRKPRAKRQRRIEEHIKALQLNAEFCKLVKNADLVSAPVFSAFGIHFGEADGDQCAFQVICGHADFIRTVFTDQQIVADVQGGWQDIAAVIVNVFADQVDPARCKKQPRRFTRAVKGFKFGKQPVPDGFIQKITILYAHIKDTLLLKK